MVGLIDSWPYNEFIAYKDNSGLTRFPHNSHSVSVEIMLQPESKFTARLFLRLERVKEEADWCGYLSVVYSRSVTESCH